jgi:hypothetical protein
VFGHDAGRTHDIQHSGSKTEEQEHDQPPWARSRYLIDEPSDYGADHDAGDEFARQTQSLAHSGHSTGSRTIRLDFAGRPQCGQTGVEFATATLEVGITANLLLTGPAGFVRPFVFGHRNLLTHQTPIGYRFEVARNIFRAPAPVKPSGTIEMGAISALKSWD